MRSSWHISSASGIRFVLGRQEAHTGRSDAQPVRSDAQDANNSALEKAVYAGIIFLFPEESDIFYVESTEGIEEKSNGEPKEKALFNHSRN